VHANRNQHSSQKHKKQDGINLTIHYSNQIKKNVTKQNNGNYNNAIPQACTSTYFTDPEFARANPK